jgi:hypothetical protein
MKEVIRIYNKDHIFFDAESTGNLYLPRIIAFDLSPENGEDVFIIKIINLVTPHWVMWPDRIDDRTGYVRWFRSSDGAIV